MSLAILALVVSLAGLALAIKLETIAAAIRRRERRVVEMTPGPGEAMRTVIVSDKPLTGDQYNRIREHFAEISDKPGPLLIDGGLRIERWPMPANGPEVRTALDPFEEAAIALRGRRWNTREADALAELVELGRDLP